MPRYTDRMQSIHERLADRIAKAAPPWPLLQLGGAGFLGASLSQGWKDMPAPGWEPVGRRQRWRARSSAFSPSMIRKTSAPIAIGGPQASSGSGVVPNQVFMKGR